MGWAFHNEQERLAAETNRLLRAGNQTSSETLHQVRYAYDEQYRYEVDMKAEARRAVIERRDAYREERLLAKAVRHEEKRARRASGQTRWARLRRRLSG